MKQARPMETVQKTCRFCSQKKPLSEYGWQNHDNNILRSSCRDCDSRAGELFGIEDEYEARRSARLFLKYDISPDQEAELFKVQDGACAACGEIPEDKRLLVDYCIENARVRGLVCPECRKAVGRIGSDLSTMHRTIAYLQSRSNGAVNNVPRLTRTKS